MRVTAIALLGVKNYFTVEKRRCIKTPWTPDKKKHATCRNICNSNSPEKAGMKTSHCKAFLSKT